MSLYTEIARLNPKDPEHTKLVEELARAKAKHDVTRETFHRKDPKVLETLIAYRNARLKLREAGNQFDDEKIAAFVADEAAEAEVADGK